MELPAPRRRECLLGCLLHQRVLEAVDAQSFHAEQIGRFAETEADKVSAFTISTVNEGVCILRAVAEAGMPVVVSCTTHAALRCLEASTALPPFRPSAPCRKPTRTAPP